MEHLSRSAFVAEGYVVKFDLAAHGSKLFCSCCGLYFGVCIHNFGKAFYTAHTHLELLGKFYYTSDGRKER